MFYLHKDNSPGSSVTSSQLILALMILVYVIDYMVQTTELSISRCISRRFCHSNSTRPASIWNEWKPDYWRCLLAEVTWVIGLPLISYYSKLCDFTMPPSPFIPECWCASWQADLINCAIWSNIHSKIIHAKISCKNAMLPLGPFNR